MAIDKKDFSADDPSSPGTVDDSGPVDLGSDEERRRRRKRAGLRVPSDNVPRPQSAAVSSPILAASPATTSSPTVAVAPAADPIPEPILADPEIPYPAAAPPRRADTEQDIDVDVDMDAEPEAEAAELADEDLVEERSDPRPGDGVETSAPPAPGSRADSTIEEVEPVAEHDEVTETNVVATAPTEELSAVDDAGRETTAAASGAETPIDTGEEVELDEIEEVSSGPNAAAAATAAATTSTPPAAASPPPAPPAAAAHPPAPPPPKPAPPPPAAAQPPRAAQAQAAAAAAAAAADQSKPRKRKARAWFEEIFDDDYLRTLPFLTPQATQREAAFLADGLAVKPGQHLLDLGCGYGRHAMELAARGFNVVALDLSLPLLIRGADEAQRRGLNINFVHGDMRELTFDTQFDGAYCVFSTFGYFDDEMNKRVATNVCRALKPGARFVVEVLNRDYIVADLPTRVWWEGDGCVVLEEVDFNYYTSRMVSNRSVVFEDGRQLEQEISIRCFSLHELGKLLHQAGFRVIEISGNLAARGRFFGSVSRQIIVVAEKRADATPPRPGSSADQSSPGDLPGGNGTRSS